MITNKILSSLAIGLIATSTFGITWKGKFAEQSTSYTVYLAQQGAMKRGASKAKALTRLCDFYKGLIFPSENGVLELASYWHQAAS